MADEGSGAGGTGGLVVSGIVASQENKEPSRSIQSAKTLRNIAIAATRKGIPLQEALEGLSARNKLKLVSAPVRAAREAGFGEDVAGFLLSFAPEIVRRALEFPRAQNNLGFNLLKVDPLGRLDRIIEDIRRPPPQPEVRQPRGIEPPVIRRTLPGTQGAPLPDDQQPRQQPTARTPQSEILRALFNILCQTGLLPSPPCPARARDSGGGGFPFPTTQRPAPGGEDVPLIGGEGGGSLGDIFDVIQRLTGTIGGGGAVSSLPVPRAPQQIQANPIPGSLAPLGSGVLAPIVPALGTPPKRQSVVYVTPNGTVKCANYQREPTQAWKFTRDTGCRPCRPRRRGRC